MFNTEVSNVMTVMDVLGLARASGFEPDTSEARAHNDAVLAAMPAVAKDTITNVAFHTNQVQDGSVFIALAGAATHGIRFANVALQAGSSVVISDKLYDESNSTNTHQEINNKVILVTDAKKFLLAWGKAVRKMRVGLVVGITGSVGKTTTKTMVAAALNCDKTQGNFNTPLALAKTLVDNKINGLADEPLVLELGIDHVGEMDTLLDLVQPDLGILTHITASHLDGLGDVETVAHEKKRLLHRARKSWLGAQAWSWLELEEKEQLDVSCYGLARDFEDSQDDVKDIIAVEEVKAGIWAFSDADLNNADLSDDGSSQKMQKFNVLGQTLHTPALGDAVLRAMTVGMAVASFCKIPLQAAAERMAQVRLEPRRLDVHHVMPNLTLIDDAYNSNMASMEEALQVLVTMPKPHCLIVGDMLELGAQKVTLHCQLGERLQAFEDIQVLAVGEAAAHIKETFSLARHFATLSELLEDVKGLELPNCGTILLKASQGMQFIKLLEALKLHYSDLKQAMSASQQVINSLGLHVEDRLTNNTAAQNVEINKIEIEDVEGQIIEGIQQGKQVIDEVRA